MRKDAVEKLLRMPQPKASRKNSRRSRFPKGVQLGYGQSDDMSQTLRSAGSRLQYTAMFSRWGLFAMESQGKSSRAAAPAVRPSLPAPASASSAVSPSASSAGQAARPRFAISARPAARLAPSARPSPSLPSISAAGVEPQAQPASSPASGDSVMAAPPSSHSRKRAPSRSDTGSARPKCKQRSKRVLSDDEAESKQDVIMESEEGAAKEAAVEEEKLLPIDTEFCGNCTTPVLPGEAAVQCRGCCCLVHHECGGHAGSSSRAVAFLCFNCRHSRMRS